MSDETMQAAMDQAYRFLAQRFLSSYELTQKMRRKQFEDPIIERFLSALKIMITLMMNVYLSRY